MQTKYTVFKLEVSFENNKINDAMRAAITQLITEAGKKVKACSLMFHDDTVDCTFQRWSGDDFVDVPLDDDREAG
jgi:hypothetical protein